MIRSRGMIWLGHVVHREGGRKGIHMILVGKPEGKRTLGRPTHRWGKNTKMSL
jgi:hypothetical protein